MPANSPLALLLLLGALLLAVYASPVAAGNSFGGGRMVIVHAGRTGDVAAGASLMWRRRLEDEVAPEFPTAAAGGLLGGGEITYSAFDKNKPQCFKNCAAPSWKPYTQPGRPCLFKDRCTQ